METPWWMDVNQMESTMTTTSLITIHSNNKYHSITIIQFIGRNEINSMIIWIIWMVMVKSMKDQKWFKIAVINIKEQKSNLITTIIMLFIPKPIIKTHQFDRKFNWITKCIIILSSQCKTFASRPKMHSMGSHHKTYSKIE